MKARWMDGWTNGWMDEMLNARLQYGMTDDWIEGRKTNGLMI
jgi:hypothetical protein